MVWGSIPTEAAGPAIVTLGELAPDAGEAIAAAGGETVAALTWSALESLGDCAAELVIAAVPRDTGHGAIERLATLLDAHALPAIVVLEPDAIDAVAGTLVGARTELLCDASPADWAVALAWATLAPGSTFAGVREGGEAADRLRRLHEAVARIGRQLLELAESPGQDGAAERRPGYAAGPGGFVAIDPADIRRVIRARRLRAQFFDGRLLEDPGWDMLLDLFAAELERARVSVSSLCIAAAVAPTTALRWISRMVEAGLMVRLADAGDRRRAFVALSRAGSDAMRAYVVAAERAGVPLA